MVSILLSGVRASEAMDRLGPGGPGHGASGFSQLLEVLRQTRLAKLFALAPGYGTYPRPKTLHPPHVHDQAAVENALVDESADYFTEAQNLSHRGVVGARRLGVELGIEHGHHGFGNAEFGAPANDLHDEICVVVSSWHGCLLCNPLPLLLSLQVPRLGPGAFANNRVKGRRVKLARLIGSSSAGRRCLDAHLLASLGDLRSRRST